MYRFNPAEAEEGFSRGVRKSNDTPYKLVSIQPKPKKGLVAKNIRLSVDYTLVSIQPKPKKGLVDVVINSFEYCDFPSFNPAEAEEGFSSGVGNVWAMLRDDVSIQPKPKKGLVGKEGIFRKGSLMVSIQPKPKKGLVGKYIT